MKYRYMVTHDYEIFPLLVEVEADSHTDALRKVADRIEELGTLVGRIENIEVIK